MYNKLLAPILLAAVALTASSVDLSARTGIISDQKISSRTVGRCIPSATTVVLTTTGTNTWIVPSCWNTVKVEVLGGGGSGAASAATNHAGGGSGAAFSSSTNISVTPGASITYGIGTGGAPRVIASGSGVAGNNGNDSWFNAASFAACTNSALCASAKGGLAGQFGLGPPTVNGGQASGGVGSVKFNGGSVLGGGSVGGQGGAGAAGPNGAGNNVPAPSSFVNQPGSAGDAGFGGAAGAAGLNPGGNGTEWACGVGSGGGGGGSVASANAGGNNGGAYGAGGGAASGGGNLANTSGGGSQGVICLTRIN